MSRIARRTAIQVHIGRPSRANRGGSADEAAAEEVLAVRAALL